MQVMDAVVGGELDAVRAAGEGNLRILGGSAQRLSRRKAQRRHMAEASADDDPADALLDGRHQPVGGRHPFFGRAHCRGPPLRKAVKASASATGCSSGTKWPQSATTSDVTFAK